MGDGLLAAAGGGGTEVGVEVLCEDTGVGRPLCSACVGAGRIGNCCIGGRFGSNFCWKGSLTLALIIICCSIKGVMVDGEGR